MNFGFSYVGVLGVTVIILGIGHIGIHLMHRGEIRKYKDNDYSDNNGSVPLAGGRKKAIITAEAVEAGL